MLVLKKVKSNGMCSLVVFAQSRSEAGWNQASGVNSDEPGLEGSERGSYRKWPKKTKTKNKEQKEFLGWEKSLGRKVLCIIFMLPNIPCSADKTWGFQHKKLLYGKLVIKNNCA